MTGTQYFEFSPGPYTGQCWSAGSCFVDEYTFALFEGIFEKHAADYDHFAFVEISRTQWESIIREISELSSTLTDAGDKQKICLPFGGTCGVEDQYERSWGCNQIALAVLLGELGAWLHVACSTHETISLLGM